MERLRMEVGGLELGGLDLKMYWVWCVCVFVCWCDGVLGCIGMIQDRMLCMNV